MIDFRYMIIQVISDRAMNQPNMVNFINKE
jgi:hypothetical protein